MKKYKYSRKEWFEKWKHIGIGPDPKKDLLSTLPPDKEEKKCKHDWRQDKTAEGYINCVKCGKMEKIEQTSPSQEEKKCKHKYIGNENHVHCLDCGETFYPKFSPSPLDDLEEIKGCFDIYTLSDKINQIIKVLKEGKK